jgi:hypothetical protein
VVGPGRAGLGQAGPQKSLIFLYRIKRNLSHVVYLQLSEAIMNIFARIALRKSQEKNEIAFVIEH